MDQLATLLKSYYLDRQILHSQILHHEFGHGVLFGVQVFNGSLNVLNLGSNGIGAEGVEALCDWQIAAAPE